MTGLTEYLRKPFDVLYAITSNETAQDGVYADTRSEGGVYSITSTQPGEGTYAAYEADSSGAVPARETDTDDCEDPQTCPTCKPIAADD